VALERQNPALIDDRDVEALALSAHINAYPRSHVTKHALLQYRPHPDRGRRFRQVRGCLGVATATVEHDCNGQPPKYGPAGGKSGHAEDCGTSVRSRSALAMNKHTALEYKEPTAFRAACRAADFIGCASADGGRHSCGAGSAARRVARGHTPG
jgi:hypothetical protein